MKYDILADWMINYFCNFDCDYCYYSNDERKTDPSFKGHKIQRIVNGFDRSGFVWLVHMTGGEPFLQPHFLELCQKLTLKHYISINTNLSTQEVYGFPNKINPQRVAFIHCSLHIAERKRLGLVEDFIKKYLFLKRNGFYLYVTQVMSPPVLGDFNSIFNFFKKEGIIVHPKVFRGDYQLKHYPESYTNKEKRRFLKYLKLCKKLDQPINAHIDVGVDEYLLDADLSFKGQVCSAGKDFVFINYQGDVFRCQGDLTNLGNIFDGEISLFKKNYRCPVEISPCPYYCLKYAR